MKPLIIIPADINIAFIRRRFIFFAFSAALILTSIALTFTKGLNFGIDFVGGIVVEVRTPGVADIGAMRESLGRLKLGDLELQGFGDKREVLIRVQRQEGGDDAQKVAVDAIKRALGDKIEYRRTEFVGPKVSAELLEDGIMAVCLAMLAIMVYIWFRFEWQF
ncbi:MAG: protein translocase subunit SecF, partial [Proteobacteria bacterium]|nr:protein translocase subunit SecF [Pseudomonadota bacterium]